MCSFSAVVLGVGSLRARAAAALHPPPALGCPLPVAGSAPATCCAALLPPLGPASGTRLVLPSQLQAWLPLLRGRGWPALCCGPHARHKRGRLPVLFSTASTAPASPSGRSRAGQDGLGAAVVVQGAWEARAQGSGQDTRPCTPPPQIPTGACCPGGACSRFLQTLKHSAGKILHVIDTGQRGTRGGGHYAVAGRRGG